MRIALTNKPGDVTRIVGHLNMPHRADWLQLPIPRQAPIFYHEHGTMPCDEVQHFVQVPIKTMINHNDYPERMLVINLADQQTAANQIDALGEVLGEKWLAQFKTKKPGAACN